MRTLLVLILCGCEPTVRVETLRIGGDLDELRVDVEAGNVEITRSDVSAIEIVRTTRGPGGGVVVDQAVVGGVATLTGACRSLAPCDVDLVIRVPADLPVDVHTGAGDVDIVDVSDVIVEIGRGALRVQGTTTRLHARLGWGDADVSLLDPPEDLAVELAGGDATVRIPTGTYDIDVAAFGGDAIVGVREGVGPRVHVRTQAGSAYIFGRDLADRTRPG